MLATVYISQKRMADAIGLFERALKANRGNSEALELIAEGYLGVRPRRAVQIYTELTDHDPKNAVLWKNRGVCEYRAGLAEEAILSLKRAVKLDPVLLEAYLSLGTIYASQGRPPAAIGVFKQALAMDSSKNTSEMHEKIRASMLALESKK